jgi:hypothetical protein
MGIKPSSSETVERAQEMLRAAVRLPTTSVKNTALAAHSDSESFFEFHGMVLRSAPLPYGLGLEMQEVMFELKRLAMAEEEGLGTPELQIQYLEQLKLCCERAVHLFWKAAKPVSWWQRLWYRYSNPFLGCSAGEVSDLLAFFSQCRMKSRVRLLGGLALRQSLSSSMLPMTSPTLPPISAVG